MGLMFSFCAVLFISAVPLTSDVHSVVRALERRYQHAATLRAVFFERYTDGNGSVAAESGTVYFSHPGRMRWEYESPEPKLFLVDGTNVWFYVPADRTASRAKMKESSDWRTPIALLVGKADLSRLCGGIEIVGNTSAAADAPEARPSEAGNTVLRCTPRKSAGEGEAQDPLREVLLETDPEAHLVRVVIHE